MQKFGLKKCLESKFDFYIRSIKNIELNCIHLQISKISSCIVNYKVLDIDFIDSSNTLRINLIYDINILYITEDSNDLHSYEKQIPVVEYINIKKVLYGIPTKEIFVKNKFDLEIYIENISCINLKNNNVIVNYMYICAINIIKDFSISYIIDNTISENIYSTFYDGENLTQNTHMTNMKISNLSNQVGTKNIVFVGEYNEYRDVYIYKNKNNIINLKNIINVENVNDYVFVNKNTVILCTSNNLQSYLYTLNIITSKNNRLNIDLKYKDIKNLRYSKLFKNIFFISEVDEKKCLCKIDLNSNVDIIFNHYETMDYIIIDQIQKSVLKIKKDNYEKIFLLDLNNNILSPVILNNEYISIHSFLYFENNKHNSSILFLLKCTDETVLLEYKLNTFQTNIVYSHKDIRCFDVSNISGDIFIVIKENNFYEVIKITNSYTESVLKTQSDIKDIYIYINT